MRDQMGDVLKVRAAGNSRAAWIAALPLFVWCLMLWTAGCSERSPQPGRFNLLVIILDTQRADRLGCYGYPRPTSPILDAFAQEAAVFERVESASPWTAPALLSLMTSLYPDVHQVVGFPNPGRMSGSITTLAEKLKQRDYATAAFTEGGYAKGAFGLDQGFDTFPKNPGDEETNYSNMIYPSRLESNVERSLVWLRQHAEERFFLLFHTYEPHTPYRAPESYIRIFRPDYSAQAEQALLGQILEDWKRERTLSDAAWARLVSHYFHCLLGELPPDPEAERLFLQVRSRIEPFPQGDGGYADETVTFARDLYDAEVRYTDEQVSRLLRELDDLGLREHTVVVVVSDHGEGLGEHNLMEHGAGFYDELLHVALMIRVPGEYAGLRVPELVRSVDLMPTLLDLLAVSAEDLILQGRSLMPVLRGQPEAQDPVRVAYSAAPSLSGEEKLWHSIRTPRWRYTEQIGRQHAWLFDLSSDPDESRNVVKVEAETAARMHELLVAQRQANGRLQEIYGASQQIELDEETRRQLRSLGYID